MAKILCAATLATAAVATQIVFKKGTIKVDGVSDQENFTRGADFKVDRNDWKMQFRWPKTRGNKNDYRCTATMISPQIALTAAHCVRAHEVGCTTSICELKVKIAGQTRKIEEIRVPECWNFA